MRIGVNTIHLAPGSGDEDTYLRCLLAALRKNYPDVEIVLFTDPINHETFGNAPKVCVAHTDRDVRGASLDNVLKSAIIETPVDRLLTPLATAPAKCPVPVVAFVAELQLLEEGGEGLWWGDIRPRQLRKTASKVSAIIAPTEFARRRLLEWLGVPMDRVVVARPGVDHMPIAKQPCTVDQPYLLVVGQTHPYRNIERLMKAFARIESQIPHNLVVVGESGAGEPADWGERVLRFHHCPLAQLSGLYQHCDLAIFPATADASGMMVLEALYAGARILAGKIGAVPEVARGAPLYCDPLSMPSIGGAMQFALKESEAQKEHRIRSGRQIAAEHFWAKCAERALIALKR